MSVIDDHLQVLSGPEKQTIGHMYKEVRRLVPEATEEMSYAMPSFKYRGKGLVAIMAHKNFMSLYPFGAVEKLGLDLSAYECTSGSIHFSVDKPISDELLKNIVEARQRQIG